MQQALQLSTVNGVHFGKSGQALEYNVLVPCSLNRVKGSTAASNSIWQCSAVR